MTDFHNHFTASNAVLCSADLLPQFFTEKRWEEIRAEKPHHLGEAGLDSRFLSSVPIQEQIRRLREILLFAKENTLVLTLHCVHCTQDMLEVLKDVKPAAKSVIWHGFTGSEETSAQLYKLGVIISIGPRLKKEKIKGIVSADPLFVLESDYDGDSEEEHGKIIEDVYNKVSSALGISAEKLEEMCLGTAASFTS